MKDRKSGGVELHYPHDHSMFCLGLQNEYFIAVGLSGLGKQLRFEWGNGGPVVVFILFY